MWAEDIRKAVRQEFADAARYRGPSDSVQSAEDRRIDLAKVREESAEKFKAERDGDQPRRRRIVRAA